MSVPGLVSVILPNRNHAHYLPTSLDALLAQTRPELEIVVIDDASSDDSLAVIRSYAARDSRVKLVALEKNLGINGAVAAGLAHASGEFFHMAAADDWVKPKFFEKSVQQLTRHPGAGLCFSDPTGFYESNDREVCFPLYLSETSVFYDPAAFARLLRTNYFHISSNTVLYRAGAFVEAGGYEERLGWLSDWFVNLVIALRHGACYVPEALTVMRLRDDSFSATTLRDKAAHRRPFERVLALLSEERCADIAPAVRAARILPEYRLRTLLWLLQSAQGRKFMSPQLVGRILSRAAWSHLRPFASAGLRRRLRKMVSVSARKRLRE